jgi:hypothetical protein
VKGWHWIYPDLLEWELFEFLPRGTWQMIADAEYYLRLRAEWQDWLRANGREE